MPGSLYTTLEQVVEQVAIDPRREDRLFDHTAVNAVLRALTDAVSERISELYAPGLTIVDASAGAFDEEISNFSLAIARENAWEAAVALANARADIERRTIRRLLDVRASAVARLILLPNLNPVVVGACRRIEEGRWWKLAVAAADDRPT